MAHQRHPPNHGLADIIAGYYPKDYVGHAVDVGASDGVSCNTTYGLEKNRMWTVLSVEPNPEFYPVLIQERAWVEKCACGKSPGKATLHVNVKIPEAFSTIGEQPNVQHLGHDQWKDIEVRVETVEDLLEKWRFPKLDALCIDTEGTEQDVLEGVRLEAWKPKIVVVESWVAHAHDVYMAERGYKPVSRLIHNEIYLRTGDTA